MRIGSRASRISPLSWWTLVWSNIYSILSRLWHAVTIDVGAFDWDGRPDDSQGWTLDGIYSFDPTQPTGAGTLIQSFNSIPQWQNSMDSLSAPGTNSDPNKGAIAAYLYLNPLTNSPTSHWRIDFVSPDVSLNPMCQNYDIFLVQQYSASLFYEQSGPSSTGPISVQIFLRVRKSNGAVITLPNPPVSTTLNPVQLPNSNAQWQKITASAALSPGDTVQNVIVRILGDADKAYFGYVVLDTVNVRKGILVRNSS